MTRTYNGRTYSDTPEESLEKKVRKLEKRRDRLRETGTTTYQQGEANALDFAVAFIEANWEQACVAVENRRKARST